jgi:hypothetical protein
MAERLGRVDMALKPIYRVQRLTILQVIGVLAGLYYPAWRKQDN